MTNCPSEEQLAVHLMSDGYGGDETEVIRRHLESCPRCAQWIADAHENDRVLDGLRQVLDAQADEPTLSVRATRDERQPSVTADLDASSAARHGSSAAGPADEIEGYRILAEIGRGGMGVVYEALQTSTKRKVALKVLLAGPFASPSAKRRFEREVELAAQLDHPNIVTILESGIARGRDYFAMQYVEGKRLDAYLAEHQPSIEVKLRLFVEIADAVNYAHQRGVIHRDLKPSNILIDDEGSPHVLDFGLAKPSDADVVDDPDQPLLSMTGQLMGTLPYMSPEQTTGSPGDVDTRTDVYSLGVILYEMLTGRYPYPVVGKMADVLRNIAEAEPQRPSTILRTINDEIETIVLEALAKDKARRYQSADNLARDVDRYLRGDPIEAKRDSATYVLRKMLRRHRGRVAIVSAFLVLLVVGAVLVARHRRQLNEAAAHLVMSELVDAPASALDRLARANRSVTANLADLSRRYVSSAAYPQRIMGARSGLRVSPDAFWRSIDGGPLWANGEWLELSRAPELLDGQAAEELRRRARNGSRHEKYVAFCLIGQWADADDGLIDLCVAAARNEPDPGVRTAAWWAARQHGRSATLATDRFLFDDELSQLTFVRVPRAEAYRRGADPGDPDQLPDEKRVEAGVPIASFYLAMTEVTLPAFAPFLQDPAHHAVLGQTALAGLGAQLSDVSDEQAARVAVGWVSLEAARTYCAWLTEQGARSAPARRYRVVTEDEWEYACRGANSGPYCYGNDDDYLPYFARCDGEPSTVHYVAEFMPNAYGVFDMHGGLSERCDSRYPDEYVNVEGHRGKELWVHRGGAYYSPRRRCRSTQRNYSEARSVDQYVGVRIVMEFVKP